MSVLTIADKPLKLSDLKGKCILLEFFADDSPGPTDQLPALKSAASAFDTDDRPTVLAVNFGSIESTKTYADTNKLPWTFAISTAYPQPMLLFGFHTLPSIWLIGTDGKVLARDLTGASIKTALTTALGSPGL